MHQRPNQPGHVSCMPLSRPLARFREPVEQKLSVFGNSAEDNKTITTGRLDDWTTGVLASFKGHTTIAFVRAPDLALPRFVLCLSQFLRGKGITRLNLLPYPNKNGQSFKSFPTLGPSLPPPLPSPFPPPKLVLRSYTSSVISVLGQFGLGSPLYLARDPSSLPVP